MEKVSLVIGRQSSGEEFIVALEVLPHLFISHSNDEQLQNIFIQFIGNIIHSKIDLYLSFSLSRRMTLLIKPLVPIESLFMEFSHNDFEDGKINSIDEFVSSLIIEKKNRASLIKKSSIQIAMFPPMIILIDNIFEIIMGQQKKTALCFIELLMTAASIKMFFILGSAGIYRPLLDQLITVSPSLKKKLKKSFQDQLITQPLGAELVINPDGLLFYRERNEKIYTRLYQA